MNKLIQLLTITLLCLSLTQGRENYYYSLNNISRKVQQSQDLCQFVGDDQKQISCKIDTGSFLEEQNISFKEDPFRKLKIIEYNIDRNGRGGDGPNEAGIDPIINAIKSLGDADVIILSEVSRDCPQWDSINGAEEIARALKMDWAYAVEFLEINDQLLDYGYECTIGNAILSNRPLSNIIQKSFKSQCCMFSGRAGSRSAIKATIQSYNMTVISSHLESGTGISDFLDAMIIREKQSREMVNMIDPIEKKENMIMIGGDFNSPLRQFSKGNAFESFFDPYMEKYTWPRRNTCVGDALGYFGLSAFDYMYFKNHETYKFESFICKTKSCSGFSDHFPLSINLTKK